MTRLIPRSAFRDLPRHVVTMFREYHAEFPDVFETFRRIAREVRNAGHERYSAKCIFERIRWHETVVKRNADFLLNNSLTSAYSRALIKIDPSFANFFQLRSSLGTARRAA